MKLRNRATVLAIIFCLSFFVVQWSVIGESSPLDKFANKIILGVLEDHPGEYSDEGHVQRVRAVFYFDAGDWVSFRSDCQDEKCLAQLPNSYPKEVHWTIAFNGRNLGSVTAQTLPNFAFYANVGFEKLISPPAFPTIGKQDEQFSGFALEPVYRPLVAISTPNYRDPDQWRRYRPSVSVIAAVRRSFRGMFGQVKNCSGRDDGGLIPWSYKDENIKTLVAYTSNDEWSAVELMLDGGRCEAPTDIENDPFTGQWFVVSPSDQVKYIGNDMWLVDAGDYDNDGNSELLFAISGYNLGGYRLFYRNFTKSAEFEFTYH